MEIGPFGIAKLTSVAMNVVVIGYWIKKKLLLNDYLEGRWEGKLIDEKDPNYVINCILLVTKHKGQCKGNLIYESKLNRKVFAKGVDLFVESYGNEFLAKEWRPTFERDIIDPPENNEGNDITYRFTFEIRSRWFKDCMRANVKKNNGIKLTGIWHRQ